VYTKVEGNLKMTINEASEKFIDKYILMKMDSKKLSDNNGTVLFVGNNRRELFSMQVNEDIENGIVIEGLNLQRSIGGVVVGG